MSTAARAEINRQNAASSTGPKTNDGKARSSQNAIKHGLNSTRRVLAWESQEEYEALQLTFNEQYRPGSDMECELLDRMVDCWWKLQRVSKVEDEFLAQREQALSEENPGVGGNAAVALMLSDPKEIARMRLMMRYVAQAERAWSRAVADFEKARKERLRRESEETLLAATASAETTEAGGSDPRDIPQHLLDMLPPCAPGFHYEMRYGLAFPIRDTVSDGFVPQPENGVDQPAASSQAA